MAAYKFHLKDHRDLISINDSLKNHFKNYHIYIYNNVIHINCGWKNGSSQYYLLTLRGEEVFIQRQRFGLELLILFITLIGLFFVNIDTTNDQIAIEIEEYLKRNFGDDKNLHQVNLLKKTICPQCKNPNTKLVRECEWCGNQII
jgi:hypothetical protein